MTQLVEVEVYAERKPDENGASLQTGFSEQDARDIRKAVLDDLKAEYPEIEPTEYESDITAAKKGFYLTVRFELPTEIDGHGEDAEWTTPDREEWGGIIKAAVEKHMDGSAVCYVTDNMTDDYGKLFEKHHEHGYEQK